MISSGLFQKELLAILAIAVISNPQDVVATNAVVKTNGLRGLATSITNEMSYIVSFADKDIAPEIQCAALAKSTGGAVLQVYDHVLNGCSLTFPSVQAQVAVASLNDSPAVEIVEKNQDVYLAYQSEQTSNIFESTSQLQESAVGAPSWGLDRINQCTLPLDNVITKQDATGVKVFIIDTGIYAEHDEFSNGVIGPDDCHFSIFPDEKALSDGFGHGTHVAGTTCGNQFGVSKNCQLCAVKVMNTNGGGSMSDVIAGINHVVGQCSDIGSLCVANLSLGSVGYNEIFNAAVASAVVKGVVVVVAAGNNNEDACSYSPSSAVSAVTVGATTTYDERASFSNWGPCVDVYAPGSDITSAWNSSPTAASTFSGTSMATPHVAGIAAAIRSANPSWNPAQVRDSIVNSAAVIPLSGINLATVSDINCPRPPTSAPTPCSNGMDVEIKVKTDYFPAETAWTLTNICGTGTVIKSPKYTQYATMHSTKMLCLPAGEYEFTITDKAGDGNCCKYGDGSYELIVDGSSVRAGGAFKYSETTIIGTEVACSDAAQLATESPTSYPTSYPTTQPPSSYPTSEPPTSNPTSQPSTSYPTTESPTNFPTTAWPTSFPTTKVPTVKPTSRTPTLSPKPTRKPTLSPTRKPTTRKPTTRKPTRNPTQRPS